MLELIWIAVGNVGRWLVECSDRHLDQLWLRPIIEEVKERYL